MESLHPLKYISQTFEMPLAQVATELGVKRQTVNEWVGKRRRTIPDKHVSKLASIFNLDEKWFRMQNLEASEKLELQRIHVDRNATFIEYEDVFVDEEGIAHDVTSYYSPEQELSNHLYHLQNAQKVIEEVTRIIGIETDAHESYNQDIFRKVMSVINSNNHKKVRMLRDMLDYLAYRDHEFGFMTFEDDNLKTKYDDLINYYEKK
ncbi:helix-turn-helix domain-containing protein [Fictibacillus phosphorivorans]|uniref:helix-turn-helix domain-containing protein n=1 Tax=Fictibacillus phosphorivorans TaxID=1221500 RepID=UPI0035E6A9E7